MPQGNDSQILALIHQLKKAQTKLENIHLGKEYQDEAKVVDTVLNELKALIENNKIVDDAENPSFAPILDTEVTQLTHASVLFKSHLTPSFFNSPEAKQGVELALQELDSIKESPKAP
jgi:hypothetical protein